jgi:hypothetical protein
VRVADAAELNRAMDSAASHIQITNHLDLSEISRALTNSVFLTYFEPRSTLRSITVRHTTPHHFQCSRPLVSSRWSNNTIYMPDSCRGISFALVSTFFDLLMFPLDCKAVAPPTRCPLPMSL